MQILMHTSFNKVFVLTDMIFITIFPFFFLNAQFVAARVPPAHRSLGIESPLRNKNGIILQNRYLVSVESN